VTVARFDLAGSLFEVTAEHGRLIEPLETFLGELSADGAAEPGFRLMIRYGTPAAVPGGAQIICDDPDHEAGECRFAEIGDDLYLLFPGVISLRLGGGERSAEMVVAPGCEDRINATAGIHAIDAAISAGGQYLIHSAGLTLPGGGASILVHGPSGSGKTTTALALAGAGFGLASDDAMVLRINDGGASAWGLPRDLKVHRQTCAMLPWLEPLVTGDWDEADEQVLPRDQLREVIAIEAAKPVPIAGLCHLVRDNDQACAVEPLSRTDALTSLVADNLRAGRTGLLPAGKRLFDALAKLVSRVPALEIHPGGDPAAMAPVILGALEEIGAP
jgi:hypothetical protein